VPYLGERLRLRVRVDPGRVREHVGRRGDELHVALAAPPGQLQMLSGKPPESAVREALERWYRRRARVEVGSRLEAACARAGTRFARLQIRGQRTRWASCSSSGAMSFNWRLLLAPPEILEYVIEHEVAHLEVLDHSPRFWRLLGSRCPDWAEREDWLRRHGHALRLG
jgi:predicted metal-dependent hydrolase